MSKKSARKAQRGRSCRDAYERPVEQIKGATNFTDDPDGQDPVELVRELRRYAYVIELLDDYEKALSKDDGRPGWRSVSRRASARGRQSPAPSRCTAGRKLRALHPGRVRACG
jgi:hypothetical protein